MRKVPLGNTGLKVSELCFGTMTFGRESDEATSEAVYRRCREAGIDFFDCANVYAGGASEQILGKLVAGERDQVILTSKVYFKMGEGPLARGYSRTAVMHHVEGSLRRLETDYIDLYFLHHFDESTPIEDALRALDDLVAQGKIRYPAVSNFAAWQIVKALGVSAREGLAPFRCVQPMYSLLKRQAEVEILPMAEAEGLGVISYSPLAGGVLTGKYGRKDLEVEGRLNVSHLYQMRYAQISDYEAGALWCGRVTRVPPRLRGRRLGGEAPGGDGTHHRSAESRAARAIPGLGGRRHDRGAARGDRCAHAGTGIGHGPGGGAPRVGSGHSRPDPFYRRSLTLTSIPFSPAKSFTSSWGSVWL